MKRLRRWAFNFAAVMSALLFLGTVALWVRSYWFSDSIYRLRHRGDYRMFSVVPSDTPPGPNLPNASIHWVSDAGGFRLEFDHGTGLPAERADVPEGIWLNSTPRDDNVLKSMYMVEDEPRVIRVASRLGITWSDRSFVTHRATAATVPFAYAAAAFLMLPQTAGSTRLRRLWRQRLAARRNRCPACGYDLRATPDRCPECGRTVATARSGPWSTT